MAHSQSGQHHHQHNGQYVLQYQYAEHDSRKLLLQNTQILKSLVYNGSGGHGQHSAQIDAIHALPSEQMPDGRAQKHHAEYNGKGGNDRCRPHFEYFLEAELQSQRKQQDYDTDLCPNVDTARVMYRRGINEMRPRNKTRHNIP